MDIICPVCNGLSQLKVNCPQCGDTMIDNGNLDDYRGPYSPYEEQGILELNNGILCNGPDPCIHLLTCKQCSLSKKYFVGRTEI